MDRKRDGHIHTPYCPHGSRDTMEAYIKKAIELGLKEISFTEHAPLPNSFSDPAPTKDSSMKMEDVAAYIREGKYLKKKYKSEVKINVGFEVDYIKDFEEEIKEFLDEWGEDIDDSILSVHMIPAGGEYICMDYSAEEYGKLITLLGSVENVHEQYYHIVEQSIRADLGQHKPKRIGHMTLANKFQKKYPVKKDFSDTIIHLLSTIKDKDLELDANAAGWYKPDCKDSYPPLEFIKKASSMQIKIVPGSDSHAAGGLAKGFERFIW